MAAPGAKWGRNELRQVERGADAHAQGVVELLPGAFVDAAHGRQGVVDEKVHMAAFGDHRFGEAAQRGLVGNIAGKARAGLFVDDADARAVFAELPGDAPADALRAAGDDGYLILKHALPSMGVFLPYSPPPPASCRMGEKT